MVGAVPSVFEAVFQVSTRALSVALDQPYLDFHGACTELYLKLGNPDERNGKVALCYGLHQLRLKL